MMGFFSYSRVFFLFLTTPLHGSIYEALMIHARKKGDIIMTALTLRKIPFPVENAIREKAAREHVSLNKAVVGMLEESVNGKQKTQSRRYHDLDWLFGTWKKKQSGDFQKHLAETRRIDLDLKVLLKGEKDILSGKASVACDFFRELRCK
jgi:hypothetical protein